MSSESGQRLPMEELKRRNRCTAHPYRLTHRMLPARQEWDNLLADDQRTVSVGRHEQSNGSGASGAAQRRPTRALLREASSRQVSQLPTQAQMEALARDVAEMRADTANRLGSRTRERFSLRGIRLPRLSLPDIPWTSLLLGLAALALTGLVLWAVWSSLDTLWSAAQGRCSRDGRYHHASSTQTRKHSARSGRRKSPIGHAEDDHEEEQTWQQTM